MVDRSNQHALKDALTSAGFDTAPQYPAAAEPTADSTPPEACPTRPSVAGDGARHGLLGDDPPRGMSGRLLPECSCITIRSTHLVWGMA